MIDNLPPLFPAYATHIKVTCWKCGHKATLTPDKVPKGITEHEFSRRAKCKCGTGWPQIMAFPKIARSW